MWVLLIMLGIIIVIGALFLCFKPVETPTPTPTVRVEEPVFRRLDESKLAPFLDRGGINVRELMDQKILLTQPIRDMYIDSYARELLDLNNKTITENGVIDNGKEILILTNYHFSNIVEKVNSNQDKQIIILDGEPTSLSPCLLKETDVVISTKKDPTLLPSKPYNYLYLPYYAYFMVYEKQISSTLLKFKNILPKNKFCAFAYSNCDERFKGVKDRNNFYKLMQKMTGGRVDNLGRCCGGEQQKGHVLTNDEIFADYKFVIAFENDQLEGYITEKLVNPMINGSIPIYLGAKDVNDHFNSKSFINVNDFPSFEACIEYVLKVDSDDSLYQQYLVEDWLNPQNTYLDQLETKGSSFYQQVYNMIPKNLVKIPKYFDTNVNLVTFADGQCYKYDRIVKEAILSDYFDNIYPYGPQTIDPDFWIKHSEFILANPRGYGYWIWKPQVILQALDQCQEGDYLIWSDSGSMIQAGASEVLLQELKAIDETGLACFVIHHLGKVWTKTALINYFKDAYQVSDSEMNLWLDQYQVTSCLLLIRKCKQSLEIISEWKEIIQNYILIDDQITDSEPPYFKEHRHDQSILSLLCYYYKVPQIKDNLSDEKTDYRLEDGSLRPFVPARIK